MRRIARSIWLKSRRSAAIGASGHARRRVRRLDGGPFCSIAARRSRSRRAMYAPARYGRRLLSRQAASSTLNAAGRPRSMRIGAAGCHACDALRSPFAVRSDTPRKSAMSCQPTRSGGAPAARAAVIATNVGEGQRSRSAASRRNTAARVTLRATSNLHFGVCAPGEVSPPGACFVLGALLLGVEVRLPGRLGRGPDARHEFRVVGSTARSDRVGARELRLGLAHVREDLHGEGP